MKKPQNPSSGKLKFIQGNETVVEGALYAGLGFYAGYPITPSTEVAELLSERLPRHGGRFIQMEDEIASMCAIIGGSLTGKKTMTATSGPGFSLMQEALGYAAITEVPCVVVNVQRGGPSTGLPTAGAQADVMQARWGTHGDHAIIALTASNLQDLFWITVEAFNLAETYRTPVILLTDEVIGHMREKVIIPKPGEYPVVERKRTTVPAGGEYLPYEIKDGKIPPMSDFGGVHRYNVTGLIHNKYGFPSTTNPAITNDLIHHLVEKIESKANELALYQEFSTEDAEILLISYGGAARSALQVVEDQRKQGKKVGLLELNTLWPFPEEAVRRLTEGKKQVIVAEMNMGQVFLEIKKIVCDPKRVHLANRVDGIFMSHNDITKVLDTVQGKGV